MPKISTRSSSSLSPRARIYRNLYQADRLLTRQMLAEESGISMPTLYQNLADLMDDGLVRYSGKDLPTGGRFAQGLEIVPDARLAIGLSVTERHLRLIAVDLRLKECAYRVIPFDLASHLKAGHTLAETVNSFIRDYRIDRERLLGAGITIPGMITSDASRIFIAPTMGLKDIPVSLLTKDIPCPVHVENDGTASGNAEYFVTNEDRNLAYISLENGVGGAVILAGGRPYAGTNNRSGEFGHICVEAGGRRCSCGRRGCLEAYCSPRRIYEELGVSLPVFFRGVEEHEPEYETMLYDMLRHLAIAINNVRMNLDCDIVLGGYLTEFLPKYMPILTKYVLAGNPFDRDAGFVSLSTLRRHIAPVGGALYFVQRFISSI